MKTFPRKSLLTLLLALSPSLCAQDESTEDLALWFSKALGTRVRDLEFAEIPEPLLERVAKVAELDTDDLAGAEAYRAKMTIRGAAQTIHLVRVPDFSGDYWGVMAGDEQHVIRGLAWVDLDGQAQPGWEALVIQVVGRHGLPEIDQAQPRDALHQARTRAAAGEGENASTVHALFQLRDAMVHQEETLRPVSAVMNAEPNADADHAADTLKAHFRKLLDLADALGAELGQASETYKDTAKKAIAHADKLRALLRAGERPAIMEHSREMQTLCGDCHRARPGESRMGMMQHLAEVRSRYGIGNDYFVVGWDLHTPGLPENAQEVADWLWYAGLMVSGLDGE